MNSKRVFANDKDTNFNEYTKNKMGIEILKNIRSKKNSAALTQFFSYDRFILLTKTYFKYWKKNSPEIMIPMNIYNTNTSFIYYETLLSHIKDCDGCKYCKDISHMCNCKELKGILYPYGLYIANNIPNGISLHKRMAIDYWCLPREDEDAMYRIDEEPDPDCSACLSAPLNTHVFPSQNMFVFGKNYSKEKYQNAHENTQRMNAYAVYPSIKFSENKEKIDEEKQKELEEEKKKILKLKLELDEEKEKQRRIELEKQIQIQLEIELEKQKQKEIEIEEAKQLEVGYQESPCKKPGLCKNRRPLFV